MKKLIALSILVMSVSGCQHSNHDVANHYDLGVRWSGSLAASNLGTPQLLNMNLDQSEEQIMGTYSITDSNVIVSSGQVSGMVHGAGYETQMDLTFDQTVPCNGSLTFNGDFPGEMHAVVNGASACYTIVSGSGTLNNLDPIRIH